MDMFWGDRPEQRARRSLSTALWHIHRCFPGGNPIQGDIHLVHFQFPGNVYLDVEAFESQAQMDDLASLETAIRSYQGDFLPGFYDDWIINERYHLQSLYEEALARLMVLSEAQGMYGTALQAAQRLLEVDRLREDAHRLVMRIYGRVGKRNAALEQYQRCREIIHQELGTEPMTETAELYQSILNQRFEVGNINDTLELTAVPVLTPTRTGQNPFDANLPEMLVGREPELDFLHARWHEAPTTKVKLVLIHGEAGVGKTQLMKWFTNQLRQEGVPVLWGRCYEFERLLPYQPIAEALRPFLVGMSRQEIRRLPDWVVMGLTHLIPEINADYKPDVLPNESTLGRVTLTEPALEQTQLFHAIAHFLAELTSTRPRLVVLEDLHWATESTFELLHYLVRHLTNQPLMLVGTYSQEAIGARHPIFAWSRQLRQEGLASTLQVSRLTQASVETWILEMAGVGETVRPLAHRLYEETEGNPFFVVEMIKALFEIGAVRLVGAAWQGRFDQVSRGELPLPASIREVIETRVQRLSPDVQDMLRRAAVLGCEFDFDLLNAIGQRGDEATLAALDDLLRARLVIEGMGTVLRDYVFAHHKIQEIVYADISRQRRGRYHAQTARTIEVLYADQIDTWVSELAYHYELARQKEDALTSKAITYLRLAGEQSSTQFANSEAVDYFRRALTLMPEFDHAGRYNLILALEAIHNLQGARQAQAEDLTDLDQLAQTLNGEQRAEVALRQASYAQEMGGYQEAIKKADVAITLARGVNNTKCQALGYLQQGRACLRLGDYIQVQAHLEKALALATAANLPKIEADSLRNLGIAYFNQSNFEKAKATYEKALSLYRTIGDRRNEGGTLNNLGLVLGSEGHLAPARHYYEQALNIFQETGDRRGESIVSNNLGMIARYQGDLPSAKAYYAGCLAIAREIGNRRGESIALANLGIVARNLGNYAQTAAYHQHALQAAREVGDRTLEGQVLLECAIDADHQGDYKRSGSLYDQCLAICREVGNQQTIAWALTYQSLRSHHMGDHEAAREFSLQALRITRKLGSHLMEGNALTNLGHALTELEQLAEAEDAYQQATTVYRELGQMHMIMEPLAGLARISLTQENLVQAENHLHKIVVYLTQHTIEGTEEPLRVYLTCYEVLHVLRDPNAADYLQTAYEMLQEWALTIEDKQLRRSFLENVPAHRDIIAIFSGTQ